MQWTRVEIRGGPNRRATTSGSALRCGSAGRYMRMTGLNQHGCVGTAAMVQEAPLKIYARGVVSYFYFSRAPRARMRALKIRQINSAILKVPNGGLIR